MSISYTPILAVLCVLDMDYTPYISHTAMVVQVCGREMYAGSGSMIMFRILGEKIKEMPVAWQISWQYAFHFFISLKLSFM